MTPSLDIATIRAAATDAGNRYMRDHPEERPERTNAWTHNAFNAAASEFQRLARLAGINLYVLPK
jgi:hypothetical protein